MYIDFTLVEVNVSNGDTEFCVSGYANFAASWIDGEDVNKDAARLWHKVKDFYAHLHAFVRAALLRRYGNESLAATGLIPVHLLGEQ